MSEVEEPQPPANKRVPAQPVRFALADLTGYTIEPGVTGMRTKVVHRLCGWDHLAPYSQMAATAIVGAILDHRAKCPMR